MCSKLTSFSIIISVYNTPIKYINECLNSILNQEEYKSELEIVVWDDGSSLSYKKELSKLVSTYNLNIKYDGSIENQGLAKARNHAINISTGEWLIILDSDDFLANNSLKLIEDYIFLNPEYDFIYSNHIYISENGKDIIYIREKSIYQYYHALYKGTIIDPLLSSTYIFHCQIFRRRLFNELKGFDETISSGEEVDFHIRASNLSKKINIGHLDENIYYRKI
ncbi:MAG: glycosyltransferase [Thomasclavelia spiroformis]